MCCEKARTLIVPYAVTCAVMTISASVISIMSGGSWISAAKECVYCKNKIQKFLQNMLAKKTRRANRI